MISRYLLVLCLCCLIDSNAFAVVIDQDGRRVLLDYYQEKGIDSAIARQPFAASQRIMCNFTSTSAAFVEESDIVLTVRHVLIPEGAGYSSSAKATRCAVEVSDGERSTWYPVLIDSAVYDRSPQRSTVDRFDWLVLKLTRPVPDVKPYRLARQVPEPGTPVTLVTMHQDDAPYVSPYMRLHQTCRVRTHVALDGDPAAGLKTDCSSGIGASGGALLALGPDGHEVVGIMSSASRQKHCSFNPSSCSSYAVSVTPRIREAVERLQ